MIQNRHRPSKNEKRFQNNFPRPGETQRSCIVVVFRFSIMIFYNWNHLTINYIRTWCVCFSIFMLRDNFKGTYSSIFTFNAIVLQSRIRKIKVKYIKSNLSCNNLIKLQLITAKCLMYKELQRSLRGPQRLSSFPAYASNSTRSRKQTTKNYLKDPLQRWLKQQIQTPSTSSLAMTSKTLRRSYPG